MLKEVANIVRGLSADAIERAKAGHPGLPLGCAEIGTVLYSEIMNHNPRNPAWSNRDRFILSAGHGSMLLYSLLHLTGYDISLEDLKGYKQLHTKAPGHPEYGHTPGIETTTGPLGQGFANAVGMALGERMLVERYNTEEYNIIDHNTYTLLGDGCMMEGITSEAASLAGHLGLGRLIAIYDDNNICIEGSTDLTFTEDVGSRFRSYDWHVIEGIDGHDIEEVKKAIIAAKEVKVKPSLIIAKTHIGYGSPNKQDTSAAHGAPLGPDEVRGLKENLSLPVDEEFYISAEVKDFYQQKLIDWQQKNDQWNEKFKRWSQANPELKKSWDLAHRLELSSDFEEIINDLDIATPIATRSASGKVLNKIAEIVPYLVGGSADLAPSNKSYLANYEDVQKDKFTGRNVHFGIREHAMGAIANGISIYGRLRPYVATFLVFSDYMKSAIRMAAMMKQPVIYIFTHDSIYIGGDGPTHQPVEQIEGLRVIPNLAVIRPADAEETKAAWVEAMNRKDGPTALILSRQNLPGINKGRGLQGYNRGGYIVVDKDAKQRLDVLLLASGSELSLAINIANHLEEKQLNVRVISVPNREKFSNQNQEYLDEVLGEKDALRVVLEAGVGHGWYRFLRDNYYLVSVNDFGLSGPGEEVAKEFGFKKDEIVKEILKRYQRE